MNIKKKKRLEEDIKRHLSLIIMRHIKDPRLSDQLSITEVRITEDMKFAKVYASIIGSEEERATSIDILNNAKGYVRKELSNTLSTRHTPEIQFVLDEGIENSMRINELLRDIQNKGTDKE